LTDKPERRKHRDDSGEMPGGALSPEIHRRLSEASEHPKEHEKGAQEKPDHRYLSEEVHRELSEASRQDERIDQPVETTRSGGMDAKPEHPVERAEERRSPDVESRPQEKGTVSERFVRTEERQTTRGAQQEGAREHTDPSEQPFKSKPMPRESNSQTTEEESGRHEKVKQPAEVKRTDEAKPEQKGLMVRQLPESQEHESRLPEKETAPEQLTRDEERQSTSKTQAEKIREPQVEQPDSKPSLSKPEPQESNSKGKESATEHHAEQEKVAKEKPDQRYPNEETHQISETSQQHRRDNQPGEATSAQDTRTKPEQMGAQSDSTTKRLPESPDRVTAATQKHEFPQLPVRTEGKQAMEATRQEKESVTPMERADNTKGQSNSKLIPNESNSHNDTRIKPEPAVTNIDPRVSRELSDRSEKELGKGAISKQPKGTEGDHVTRENEAEKVKELSAKPANHKESRSGNKEPALEHVGETVGHIKPHDNLQARSEEHTLRQAETGQNEKYHGELTDKSTKRLEPVVREDNPPKDAIKSKGSDPLEQNNHQETNIVRPTEQPSRVSEASMTEHLEKERQRTEKNAREGLRRDLDRIKELSPRTHMLVERSLNGFLKKKDETSVVRLVRETADYLEASKDMVPQPKPTVKGIYQHAHGDVESAADALHALAHYHRTDNIEIRLRPIFKGKKTELYIPSELWRATAGYEAVKFNLTFPNGEKTTMYKSSCHGKYKDVPSLCNDIAERLRSSRYGAIEARLEELTKEQFIQETPKRKDVDYEFKGENFYIKIGDKRIKAHDVTYSFMRSSPTTTSELRIGFNILDKKSGKKDAFIVSYDGRNPPKTQVMIGTHPAECTFSYDTKLNCIEVQYKHDTGRKTGDHRIDHVKVIDMKSHPEKVVIDLSKQTGVVSKEVLEMTKGSTTRRGAAGNIVCGAVQRIKYETHVMVESNGNEGGVDVEIPSQQKFFEVCMCTNEKNLFTSLTTAEIKALNRLRKSQYRDYTAVAMAVYIDRKNGHLHYIEKLVKEGTIR